MAESKRDKLKRELASTVVGEVSPTVPKEDLYVETNNAFIDDTSQIWSSAYRQFAPFQALQRTIEDIVSSPDDVDDYDPFKDPQLKNLIANGQMYRFMDSGSPEETKIRIDRYMADLEDLAVLQMSDSGTAEFFAHMSSPTIFAPIAPIKAFKGATFGKRFTNGAGFTAAIMAPEEIMKASQSEGYTAATSLLSMTAASVISGTLTGALGRSAKPKNITDPDGQIYRSAGANVSPEKQWESAKATINNDALAETGVGLENIPWNPVTRLLKSENPISRSVVASLVSLGGMMQTKVQKGLKMDQSVESFFNATYLGPLLDTIAEADKAYLAYRGVAAKQGDIGRSIQMLRQGGSDFINRETQFLKQIEFRTRIGKAMRRGGRDTIQDEATQFVERAAVKYRETYDFIKSNAEEVRLFEKEIQGQIKIAEDAGNSELVSTLKTKLADIRANGVSVNTAESYLNRVWRVDKIMNNEEDFLRIVTNWAMRKYSMTNAQASKFSKEVMDEVTRSKPYFDLEEGTSQIDWVANPSGVKARTFEIPDELVEEFLENDVEVLLRHHTKTMGIDIELTRAFGDIDMRSVIKEITDGYDRLINEATNVAKRNALKKGLENDLRDLRGLRDRVRGTYGASKDPHAMSSRFVRGMKSFNVLVGMGGAVVSSVPDMARTVMVEGLSNTYEYGLRNLFASYSEHLKRLQRKELRHAGVAADATLGLRSAAFSDVGDMFGSRSSFERGLGKSTNAFFIMNGLNYWNQVLKEFAGNVSMLSMTKALTTNWAALTRTQKEKLLKNGIDQQDHLRMYNQIRTHGRSVEGNFMPETDKWTDTMMRLKFRTALNQNVDRIIVTPGAGDRALWTSTEFGSLLTQFKSYGQGAVVRVLTSGLQEKDAAFWQGALLLVGLAGLVNEFKRVQYGIEEEEGFDEKLLNAVDRSGLTGSFMDINNVMEKLSNNKLGLGPALTDQKTYRMPDIAKASAVFGPAISNIGTASSVLGDVVTGNITQETKDSARFITPAGNFPPFDPILDGIFGQ